ncbi:MAG: TauD/TfdA family dioxygenase [Rhodospirillaceae bacterium]|nr:MAG: TauD/TfdA family dioxygenase [Rhodospirillaceae bacterium]
MAEFTLHKLHDSLGAEVQGLDLSKPLSPDTRKALIQAWIDHLVLLFRDQDLTPETQREFCEQFGELGGRLRKAEERPEGHDADNIMLVTNVRRNGVPIGSLPDGEMFFHHDKCYAAEPDWGTMLYAMEVTRVGGHTLFANMYDAWDTLPGDLKTKIDGRKVLHIYKYLPTERVDLTDDIDKYDHHWQPIVITHPKSGRRALYVNELMSALIDGYSEGESRDIIEALNAHVKSADVIYEHKWRRGDLMMWDNWCTMHARTDFPRDQTRMLRRYTISGQKLSA